VILLCLSVKNLLILVNNFYASVEVFIATANTILATCRDKLLTCGIKLDKQAIILTPLSASILLALPTFLEIDLFNFYTTINQ